MSIQSIKALYLRWCVTDPLIINAMDTHIRKATTEDLPVILEIINQAIIHTTSNYDYEPATLAAQSLWFEKKQQDRLPVIVAESDGQVAGFGTYGSFRQKIAYQYSVEHSIYVAEPYQGSGIGKLLMQELIRLARAQGFHTMIAGIDAENQGSYAFHQKCGFAEVGRFREVGYKFDRWLDLIFMQLFLQK